MPFRLVLTILVTLALSGCAGIHCGFGGSGGGGSGTGAGAGGCSVGTPL